MTELVAEGADGERNVVFDHFAAFDVIRRYGRAVKAVGERGFVRVVAGGVGLISGIFIARRDESDHQLVFVNLGVAVFIVYGEIDVTVFNGCRKRRIAFGIARRALRRFFNGGVDGDLDDAVIHEVVFGTACVIFRSGKKTEIPSALRFKIRFQGFRTVAEEHFRPIGMVVVAEQSFVCLAACAAVGIEIDQDHEQGSIRRSPISVIKFGDLEFR